MRSTVLWFGLFVCLAFGDAAVNAQIKFHPGITTGVPFTDTLSSSSSSSLNGQDSSSSRFHSETKRLLIGPSLRVDITKALGLQFDALYQRVDYDSANSNNVPEIPYTYQSFTAIHADRWQFPLLIQYRRRIVKTQFFVEAGPAVSTVGNIEGSFRNTSTIFLVSSSSSGATAGARDTRAGITGGIGVDVPVLHTHLRPEFRYSRWFQSSGAGDIEGNLSFSNFLLGTASSPFESKQNEASFVLSLSY